MSDGDRNEYRALLNVFMEQQKFVVNHLGQATDNVARFSPEFKRLARLLTSMGGEVAMLSSKLDAVVQRLDDVDRRVDTAATEVRAAHSEVTLQGNKIVNAIKTLRSV